MQESNNFYDDEIRLKDVILKIQLLKSEFFKMESYFYYFFLLAVLGVLYAMKKQITYKAELNFVVEDNSGGGGTFGKYSGLASQFGFDMVGRNIYNL